MTPTRAAGLAVVILSAIGLPSPGAGQTVGAVGDTVVMDLNGGLALQFSRIRTTLTALAARMPADAYGYQPTPDVRTFAAGIGHAATTNINVCANLLGRRHALSGRHLDQTMTAKDELVGALEESFAFCDEYVSRLTPGQLSDSGFVTWMPRPEGRQTTWVAHGLLLANLIAHNNEMYGYLAMFLRLKGLVPPTSDRPAPR